MNVPPNLPAWLGQATTGAGASVILAALAALAAGQVTWQAAMVAIVGGICSMIWPESPGIAPAAQDATADVVKVIEAYKLGRSHAAPAPPPQQSAVAAAQPGVPA